MRTSKHQSLVTVTSRHRVSDEDEDAQLCLRERRLASTNNYSAYLTALSTMDVTHYTLGLTHLHTAKRVIDAD